jgi:hypothetical protein
VIRYIRTTYVHQSVVLISLMLTYCSGALVSPTPSAIVTEAPPLSPTPASEGPASKIDKILTVHTERETFTGTVLVARNDEILRSRTRAG